MSSQDIDRMGCSAVSLVLKPRRAILSGFNVPNSRESGFLSVSLGRGRPSSEALLTQGHSWLSSVLPEFAPLTPWSSNFSEIVVSRQLVEIFSTALNRPGEVLLRFERAISPCISRFSSKKEAICNVRRPPALSGRGAISGVLTSEMYQFERTVASTESPGRLSSQRPA